MIFRSFFFFFSLKSVGASVHSFIRKLLQDGCNRCFPINKLRFKTDECCSSIQKNDKQYHSSGPFFSHDITTSRFHVQKQTHFHSFFLMIQWRPHTKKMTPLTIFVLTIFDVICDLLPNRSMATWKLYVQYCGLIGFTSYSQSIYSRQPEEQLASACGIMK